VIKRIPIEPPQIPHIDTSNGPLWSVMIPAYNCINYLGETIESVLVQDMGEEIMQIEVIDDASTDGDVESLVKSIGKGRVGYYRHSENMGSLRSFETAINRTKGRLIHMLHGDDKVKPGFYTSMENLFNEQKEIGAAFCRTEYIDEDGQYLHMQTEEKGSGILPNILLLLGERQRIETPSIVVKRTVYEKLGAFRMVTYGEDWDMWIRIAANYPVAYNPQPLAMYRRLSLGSITSQKITSAENIRDLITVMKITEHYFPPNLVTSLQKKAKTFYAGYAVRTANKLWHQRKNKKGAFAQLKAAFMLSKNPVILFNVIKVFFKVTLRYDKGRIFNSNVLL